MCMSQTINNSIMSLCEYVRHEYDYEYYDRQRHSKLLKTKLSKQSKQTNSKTF